MRASDTSTSSGIPRRGLQKRKLIRARYRSGLHIHGTVQHECAIPRVSRGSGLIQRRRSDTDRTYCGDSLESASRTVFTAVSQAGWTRTHSATKEAHSLKQGGLAHMPQPRKHTCVDSLESASRTVLSLTSTAPTTKLNQSPHVYDARVGSDSLRSRQRVWRVAPTEEQRVLTYSSSSVKSRRP
jgi:hypothetical protein